MFKFAVVLAVFVAAAHAGLIGHGYGGYALSAAPIAVAAPISHATSYQNSNLVALHATPVVAAHAPIAVAHAPIAVAHAPVVATLGFGHGGGYYH